MKTIETDGDVAAFLTSLANRTRAEDAACVAGIMARVTGCPPRLWGDSIIGFDRYSYTRKDGSAHQFFVTGVSPRKQNLAIYIMPGVAKYQTLLESVGPHKHTVSCLYVTRLARVNLSVLEELIAQSVKDMRAAHH